MAAVADAGLIGLDPKVSRGENPAFATCKNVFMLPHIGSATRQTHDAMGFRASDNLDAFFAENTPPRYLL